MLPKIIQGKQLSGHVRVEKTGGRRKGAGSYFPPEDRVQLVRLVSHGELPGERSGESTTDIS